MNLYILDTDILTLYQIGDANVIEHVKEQLSTGLTVSVITVEEQLSGWYTQLRRAKKPEQLAKVYQRLTDTVRSLSRFHVLSFTIGAMHRYDELRAKRLKMSKNDLRIAAIVLEAGGILVTRNIRDFERVPGLKIEDWSK